MLLAPLKVAAPQKEMTGNIMTISYMTGLTAGSLVGYVFENMLGPPIIFPCLTYPFIPKPPDEFDTTTTVQTTTTQLMPTLISIFTTGLITEIPTDVTTFSNFLNTTSTLTVFGTNSTLLNEN